MIAAVLAGASLVSAPEAAAGTPSSVRMAAYYVAMDQRGDPYKYGAVGPSKFDCSGLTLYSYKKVGRTLPRVAQDQYNKSRKIASNKRTKGDLVFFGTKSNISHVGIYAGYGKVLHAPHTGAVVRIEKIWTSKVLYGRFS
jgi:cell wall-associated NlpC family hydrolase